MAQQARTRAWRLVNKPVPREKVLDEDAVSTDVGSSSDAESFSSRSSASCFSARRHPVTLADLAIAGVQLPRRNVPSFCPWRKRTVTVRSRFHGMELDPIPGTPVSAMAASDDDVEQQAASDALHGRRKEDESGFGTLETKDEQAVLDTSLKTGVLGACCSMTTSCFSFESHVVGRQHGRTQDASMATAMGPLLYGPVSVSPPSPRKVARESAFAKARASGNPMKVRASASFNGLSEHWPSDFRIGSDVFDFDELLPVKKRLMFTEVASDAVTIAANSVQHDVPVKIFVREGFLLGETPRTPFFGPPPGLVPPAR